MEFNRQILRRLGKHFLLINISLGFYLLGSAQSVRPQETTVSISPTSNRQTDSLYISYDENVSGLTFSVINTTEDTVYLFSSYLPALYHSSKYLHRIDKGSKVNIYRISFLPLIPFLSTKPNDRLIVGSNRIVEKTQVLYNFVRILPGSFYEINMAYSDLFKDINQKGNLVCDFDANEADKFTAIKFKTLSADQLKGKYQVCFEFAVYHNIDLRCNQSAYYLKEEEFNKQAKAFEKIIVPVKMKHFSHRLF
jgi:hypothetical protein